MTVPSVFGKGRPPWAPGLFWVPCEEGWLARPGLGAARPLGARTVLKTQHGSLAGPDPEELSPPPNPQVSPALLSWLRGSPLLVSEA